MKKTKLMALVLVGAISLTGAGYAAWSNTITDTTSINTGNWSVVLENDSGYSYYAADQVNKFNLGNNTSSKLNGESGANGNTAAYEQKDADGKVISNWETGKNFVYTLAPSDLNANDTSCAFDFRNLHPGTQVMTRFEMRNKGSIPAKIAAARLSVVDNDGTILYKDGSYTDNCSGSERQVLDAMDVKAFFELHRGSGNLNKTLVNRKVDFVSLQDELDKLVGTVMAPTDYIHSVSDELESGQDAEKPVFTFFIPADTLKAQDGTNLGQNANFKVIVDFDFVQYNDISNGVTNTNITDVPAK